MPEHQPCRRCVKRGRGEEGKAPGHPRGDRSTEERGRGAVQLVCLASTSATGHTQGSKLTRLRLALRALGWAEGEPGGPSNSASCLPGCGKPPPVPLCLAAPRKGPAEPLGSRASPQALAGAPRLPAARCMFSFRLARQGPQTNKQRRMRR